MYHLLEKINNKPVIENLIVQFLQSFHEHLLCGKYYAGSYNSPAHLELSEIKQIHSKH